MLDIKIIRANPEKVKKSLRDRNKENLVDISEVLSLDKEQSKLENQLQDLYAKRKIAAKTRDQEK
jgi:seryl-tRNA synthetase